jgi:hypothetical protein
MAAALGESLPDGLARRKDLMSQRASGEGQKEAIPVRDDGQ